MKEFELIHQYNHIVEILKSSEQFSVIEEQDYIKNPKESGYSSYHLLLKVPIFLKQGKEYITAEVQIRTVAMDFWASLDHKIQYKFSSIVPKEVEEEMYQYSLYIKQLDQNMLHLKQIMNQVQNR